MRQYNWGKSVRNDEVLNLHLGSGASPWLFNQQYICSLKKSFLLTIKMDKVMANFENKTNFNDTGSRFLFWKIWIWEINNESSNIWQQWRHKLMQIWQLWRSQINQLTSKPIKISLLTLSTITVNNSTKKVWKINAWNRFIVSSITLNVKENPYEIHWTQKKTSNSM